MDSLTREEARAWMAFVAAVVGAEEAQADLPVEYCITTGKAPTGRGSLDGVSILETARLARRNGYTAVVWRRVDGEEWEIVQGSISPTPAAVRDLGRAVREDRA
jgi:hypothetical protein